MITAKSAKLTPLHAKKTTQTTIRKLIFHHQPAVASSQKPLFKVQRHRANVIWRGPWKWPRKDDATGGNDLTAQMNQFAKDPDTRLGVLARTGWLSRQPPEFKALIARLGRWRNFKAGEILYLAGDEAAWMVGLADGILEITFPLVGDEPVLIHRAEPGFWTGEASLLVGKKRFISVAAATNIRVFVVPTTSLRRALEVEPRHWPSLYELSLTSSITAITLLAESLSLSPRARVARILLRLANSDGSVPGSQEDLARLLGMTRSSVRRALSSLIDVGAVESGYGVLAIRDRALLERLMSEA